MSDSVDVDALALRLQQVAAATPPDALPALVGALETAKALAWSRLMVPPPVSSQTEPLLTAEELAAVIKLPVHAVRDRARRGIIPSIPIGRYVRFQASAVIAALKGDGVPRSTHPVAEKNSHKVRALRGPCPPSVQDESEARR